MNKLMMVGVVGALVTTGAMAQTAPAANPHPAAPVSNTPATKEGLRQQMMADMQRAGFTDVSVRPDSFLVHAKDRNGMPVTMLIDPNAVTEVVAINGEPPAPAETKTGGTFTTVPSTDVLTSKVIGTDVRNSANQDIGTIKDVAYSSSGMQAFIVGVGGFLGMGDHYIAVSPAAIHLSYDVGNKTWHATMNATADQLKAAPEFKYQS